MARRAETVERNNNPDVIVSDIEMPVMNGYEMVKRIRETDGETPILFSSALISPKRCGKKVMKSVPITI